ncbi:glycosyltransferase family 4 protein [Micromonospora sp. NBC_01392]|uniref:glycosyltransferase n=1 Tax=Micromonospora sp. NBC_01392 TaxID=2903588 RepID=UPI00325610B0
MSKVVVTSEYRLLRTPDGRTWIEAGPDHSIWSRYLAAFDEVRLVSRVRHVDAAPPDAGRVDGPGVEVWAVPYYEGPAQFARHNVAIRQAIARAVVDADSVILRVPSPIAAVASSRLRRRGRPYAVEVIGDPYDLFAPGGVQHPARPALRYWATTTMQQQCRSAAAVSYETEHTLQRRYPPAAGAPSVSISSVDLPAEAYVDEPRVHTAALPAARLLCVGSLDQMYKGVDTLIDALVELNRTGERHELTHVGVGRFADQLRRYADERGVAEQVTFAGWVSSPRALREVLDRADVFVMPSRTEGLPRALIEAMARGLPAIGSTAGGIPELLAEDVLVRPDDPAALAERIRALVADPARLTEASRRNLRRAQDYRADVLDTRRSDFYRTVRALSEPLGATSP